MPTIRQEINLLNSTISSTTTVAVESNEISQIDTTKYVNPTYYFEIIARNTDSSSKIVDIPNGAVTNETISVSASTTNYTRFRSSAVTISAGQIPLKARINATTTSAGQVQVKAARLIIIDNPTILTSTQTQVEIGNNETGKTNTTDAALTNPKYWKYTAANWDGSKTFYAEVTYLRSSNMDTTTIKLQEDNGSFASWTDKVTIVSAGTAITSTRVRSSSFTPTDGRNYRLVSVSSSNMSTYDIYNAKIIVDQIYPNLADSYSETNQGSTRALNPSNYQGIGQSFTGDGNVLAAVKFYLKKTNSPTGNAVAKVYAISGTHGTNAIPSGAALATSNNFDVSTLTTSYQLITILFTNSFTPTNGSNYFVTLEYSGSSGTNTLDVGFDSSSPTHGGNYADLLSGTWTASGTWDLCFYVYTGTITKLETNYLLLNTADDNTTNKQVYQTLWDSSEWSNVTNTYYHVISSDNASNSADLVDIDNSDTQVTNSSVTGANQQVSSALTMPTTGHQIDTDIDNTTGTVSASRILVVTVVSAGSATVTPSTASLTITTFAPTIALPQLVTPSTASLTTSTFTPSVTIGILVTPSVASLTLSTFAPTVSTTNNQLVTPSTATLTLTSFAPTVTATDHKTVTPTTASLILSTFAPTISVSDHQLFTPTTASLATSAFAPSVSISDNQIITPSVASITTSTFVPTISVTENQTVIPSTASLTFNTFAPTVTASDHKTVVPGAISLNTNSFAPAIAVSDNQTTVPSTLSLTLSTFTPTVTASDNKIATPDAATLILTTYAPSVSVTNNQVAEPTTANLTLTPYAPNITATDHKVIIPSTASLNITTYPPDLEASDDKLVVPTMQPLVLTSLTPTISVTNHIVVTPNKTDLSLTAYAPTLNTSDHKVSTPEFKALGLTNFAPVVSYSDHKLVIPETSSVVTELFAPAVIVQSGNITAIPSMTSLITSRYVPTVTISGSQPVIKVRIGGAYSPKPIKVKLNNNFNVGTVRVKDGTFS